MFVRRIIGGVKRRLITAAHRCLAVAVEAAASTHAHRKVIPAWDAARINQINVSGVTIPCPYCGERASEKVSDWRITDHFGLFDDDLGRLGALYGLSLPSSLPREYAACYRRTAGELLAGRSYLSFLRCKHCDLIFQNYPHTKDSVNRYYSEFYRLPWERADESGTRCYGRDDDRWIYQQGKIGEYFLETTGLDKGSKVLDLGCAEGQLCKYMERQSMEAHGIDPSYPMVNYARRVLQLDHVVGGDYGPEVYPSEFFDGIITHHVAEHVADIRIFFQAIGKHLRPGGYLLIQVPCADNLKTDADRAEVLSGGHVFCFSEKFLRSVLDAHGLTIVECRKTPCELSQLDPRDRQLWDISGWADDPCGISILSVKS